MSDLVLAIDQGTTGSTIALMDADGRLLTSVNHEFPQIFPSPVGLSMILSPFGSLSKRVVGGVR